MFQMMNQARINTGVSGMSMASTAYLNALAYVKTGFRAATLPDARAARCTPL